MGVEYLNKKDILDVVMVIRSSYNKTETIKDKEAIKILENSPTPLFNSEFLDICLGIKPMIETPIEKPKELLAGTIVELRSPMMIAEVIDLTMKDGVEKGVKELKKEDPDAEAAEARRRNYQVPYKNYQVQYKSYHNPKHPSHEEGIELWVKELKEGNPDKKYYILTKPRPDALELDIKNGTITALEYETDKSHISIKKRYYEKLGSDFNEVIIRSEDKKQGERFSPPKPNR
jgi:hypothetical protein